MPEGFEIPAGEVVLETAVDFKGLDRDLKELERRGEVAGRRVDQGFSRRAGDAAGTAEDLRRGIQGAREELEQSEGSLDDWADTAESASDTGEGLALVVGQRLAGGFRGLLGWVGRTTGALLGFTSLGLKQAGEGLRELGEDLSESNSRWRHFGVVVQGAGSALEGFSEVVEGAFQAVTGLQIVSGAAAAALVKLAKDAAEEFVPAWQRVVTLIDTSGESVDMSRRQLRALSIEVSRLAGEMGVEGTAAANAYYQVLSAMPEIVDEPQKSLEVLRAVLKATATGFVDGETAAKAITSVLNAFNLEAEQATEVSDKLFAAQQQGVLTFQEVASEIGKVADFTNVLGGSFEEILAIVATLTPPGSERRADVHATPGRAPVVHGSERTGRGSRP